MDKWFKDFELSDKPDDALISKYRDRISPIIIRVWETYGFGSILNGYLRFINPDDYRQILDDTYLYAEKSVPIITTAFGDIIVWEDDDDLFILKYKKRDFSVILGGMTYFWKSLDENHAQTRYFELDKYEKAIKLYGKPKPDECFGYFPLLGTGGKEDINNLQIVKTREHILLISQMIGGIGM